MKKFMVVIILAFSLVLSSCMNLQNENGIKGIDSEKIVEERKELYGVWLSYFEISSIVKGKSEAEYRESVVSILENLKNARLNTVFYQVRCFSDALYKSEVFPTSRYIVENEGDALEYDPFEIFIELSGEYDISVHAWVNPFRVSYSQDFSVLSDNNPAKVFYLNDEKTTNLLICDKGIFYNPLSSESRKLIIAGVKELIENYRIKGVQFDDYFYPETEALNDSELYEAYKNSGGELSIEEYRKESVSSLVSSVYSLIKSYDENISFGISPSANFKTNNNVYADVVKWCQEDGFIDYIMPQIYFGFENETMPFKETVEMWLDMEYSDSVSFYVGLAPYKTGELDSNAGSGQNEWVENSDILLLQYKYLSEKSEFKGFSLYSYSYCFGENLTDNTIKEINGLTSML
jgi:uncharacterized lipoprotein YddW (UPF0748 family)